MAQEHNPIDTGDENLSNEEQAALDQDRQAEHTEREPAPAPRQEQQRQRQDTVPHAALHEERRLRQESERRIKEREAELANERAESKKLRERTERILGSIAKGLNPDAPDENGRRPIPVLEKDPLGHVLGRLDEFGEVVRHLAGSEQQRRQMTETQQAVSDLATRAQALERDFSAKTPDYNAASQHLQQWRHEELAEMGYTDPAQRQQMIAAEALQIARAAIANNQNPAEVVYKAAIRRGFKAAAKAAAEEGEGEGEQPAPRASDEDRIRNAERGQRENRSLGNARGGAKAPLTVDRLMAMDDDAFEQAMSTAEGRALLGS